MKSLSVFIAIGLSTLMSCSTQTNSENINNVVPDSLAQNFSPLTEEVKEKAKTDGVYHTVVSAYGIDTHNFIVLEGEKFTTRAYSIGMAIEYNTEMVTSNGKEFKVCSPYDSRGCNDFYIKPDKLIASSGHTYEKIADTYTWEALEKQYKIEPTKVTKLNN